MTILQCLGSSNKTSPQSAPQARCVLLSSWSLVARKPLSYEEKRWIPAQKILSLTGFDSHLNSLFTFGFPLVNMWTTRFSSPLYIHARNGNFIAEGPFLTCGYPWSISYQCHLELCCSAHLLMSFYMVKALKSRWALETMGLIHNFSFKLPNCLFTPNSFVLHSSRAWECRNPMGTCKGECRVLLHQGTGFLQSKQKTSHSDPLWIVRRNCVQRKAMKLLEVLSDMHHS